MRRQLIPTAIAAALAAKARAPLEGAIPLYLSAFGDRFTETPEADEAEDHVVDASGITIGGDENDDFY